MCGTSAFGYYIDRTLKQNGWVYKRPDCTPSPDKKRFPPKPRLSGLRPTAVNATLLDQKLEAPDPGKKAETTELGILPRPLKGGSKK